MSGRGLLLCALVVPFLVPGAALADLDAYPKTTLAEDATATWCTYCPYAYQGLEVVHANYDWSEFASVRYYASSGSYGSPEIDAAIAYYGVGGYPTVIFNGTQNVVGGDATIAAGGPYMALVGGAYFTPSPVRVDIDSLDVVTGAIQATVTMMSATDTLDNDHIRFVLTEDNVAGIHTHVTRDIVSDTISLTGQGSTATFNETFAINPAWIPANLHAVVFVQRTNKEVVQATASYAVPDYRVRAMVPFSSMQIGPSSGVYEGDYFWVYNQGLSDVYTLSLVVDEAPPGWQATYCDEVGHCYVDPVQFTLGADESAGFHVNVIPTSRGTMRYHFEVTSPQMTAPLSIPFNYLTDDLDVLVVDDDGSETYEDYFTAALDASGLSYGVWSRADARLTAEAAQTYRYLVWFVGEAYPTLDVDDRAFLRAYLDDDRHLFVTGQDIGWDLNASGSNDDPTFYHDYLHATYINDDTNLYYLNGVAGDPVSDGMLLHIQGGDGANNQAYPSAIAPYDADATEIFRYQGGATPIGAIRSVDSGPGARVVYLAFGFEAIDNPTDRATMMDRALGWLQNRIFADGFEDATTSAWSLVTP
jgi:hypothetical protein